MAPSLELENDPKVLDNLFRKEEEENFAFAMQLAFSSVLSMSLHTTIQLGVFDIVAKASEGDKLSPVEIAAQLATKNPDAPIMLDRILRILASHSVVSCSVVDGGDNDNKPKFQRLYGLTPACKYFVANEDGVSPVPLMALPQDKIFLGSWPKLKDAVLEGGIPFNMVYGKHSYEHEGLDQRFSQVFNKAMYNASTISAKEFLKFYKGFNNVQGLVDVGGGLGVSLNLITFKHPHINGINFDLPHVVEHAHPYIGIEHVGGNMFDKVPAGEAIFMKLVLHYWSDEHCMRLLKNCYKAIPKKEKVWGLFGKWVNPFLPFRYSILSHKNLNFYSNILFKPIYQTSPISLEAIFPVKLETSSVGKSKSVVDVFMMIQHVDVISLLYACKL